MMKTFKIIIHLFNCVWNNWTNNVSQVLYNANNIIKNGLTGRQLFKCCNRTKTIDNYVTDKVASQKYSNFNHTILNETSETKVLVIYILLDLHLEKTDWVQRTNIFARIK